MFNDDFFYEKLKKKIMKDIDFQTQFYGDKHLKRRFQIRMSAVGAETFREYIQKLESTPGEYDKLIKVLTVNVTEWFRNPEMYEVLKEQILPEFIRGMEKSNKKSLRIWSVGCSDGKEPYSIAIMLHDLLGSRIKDFYIIIFASDIDEEMLEKARTGRYAEEEMEKGLSREQLDKYFIKENGSYRIIPEVKSLVKFEKRDLTTDRKHVGIDILFCRNVVILSLIHI